MPDESKPSLLQTVEGQRLQGEHAECWREWGPYVSDRQWGTVREDYSADGDTALFPHDHARSRAYRWGEDGLAGFSDKAQHWCLGLAVWNGRDPILKERLFGLNNASRKAIMAKTSRNCISISTASPAMPICACSTSTPMRLSLMPTWSKRTRGAA